MGPARGIAILLGLLGLVLASATHAQDHSVVLRLRAQPLAEKGRCDEALPLLRRAREIADDHARTALLEGECAIQLHRYHEALDPLERAKELDPALAEVDLFLAIALYHLDDLGAARRALADAERALPGRAEVHLYRGLLLIHEANSREAAAELERASSIDSQAVEPIASYSAGLAWEAAQERERAKAALQRVTAQAPNSVWAQQAERALEQMESQQEHRWWFSATAGMEYDDNVVLRGDGVQQPNGISNDDDGRGVWSFNGGYEVYRDETWTLGLLGSYAGSAHTDLRDFDLQSPSVSGWLDRKLSEETLLRLQSSFEYVWYDTEKYLASTGFSTTLYHDLGDAGSTSAFFRFSDLDYQFESDDVSPGPPGLDLGRARNYSGQEYALGFDYSRFFGEETLGRTGFRYRYFDSHREYTYDGFEFVLGVFRELPYQFSVDLALSFEYRPYHNPSTFEDPPGSGNFDSGDRSETSWLFETALERPLTRLLTGSIRYSYLDNNSNVDVYDYDRHIIGVYVTIDFPN
jgi:tetratricopeptide (TPR) repeat protein